MPAKATSVTQWLRQVKEGQRALEKLWERFFPRVVGMARTRLHGSVRDSGAVKDVAQETFVGFWQGIQRGQYPKLFDRTDLWNLLAQITVHKALQHLERENAGKRGAGQVVNESNLRDADEASIRQALEVALGREPTPDLAAEVAEECQRLFDLLDEKLRVVAKLRMEGRTNQEIADICGCTERTVERRVRMIRKLWKAKVDL